MDEIDTVVNSRKRDVQLAHDRIERASIDQIFDNVMVDRTRPRRAVVVA